MAIYPGAVRTYSTKQDQITIIDANDVNVLQDELGATQRTLGTNPHIYAPATGPAVTYTSVGARLSSHETTLTSLQNQINTLVSASNNGWNTPVLSLKQSGITPNLLTLPGPANFGLINWTTTPIQDPFNMWDGGPQLSCVLGGWYHINLDFDADIDTVRLSSAQNALNASGAIPVPIAFQDVIINLLINGTVAKSRASHVPWQINYTIAHEPYVYYDGPLHQGDILSAQVGQYNGNVSGIATLTATYVRPVPGVT